PLHGYAMTLCKFRWVKIYLFIRLLYDLSPILNVVERFPDGDRHDGQVAVLMFRHHHVIPDETGYGFDDRSVIVHALGKNIDGVFWHEELVDEIYVCVGLRGMDDRVLG